MGWLAKRRLRTGPTAALPAKPDPGELLRLVQLADPNARRDGDDIVAVDVRVCAPVEADKDLTGGELERVWAVRVAAEGPLPLDFFDRYLAEGLAFRLGGLAVCRGEVSDPADDGAESGPAVILPVRPSAEELAPLLQQDEEDEFLFTAGEVKAALVPQKGQPPAVQELLPFATELTAVELRGDDPLKLGALALELSEALNGIPVDRWRFRIDAPEDLVAPAKEEAEEELVAPTEPAPE
ncbi:unnamed protein product [[Actinomadura] parvosata subsp. kistnae]|uniref:Uncharacterized protein n=1 Tax=[Actinomadura] parvosata subsp. kistnae TaxID=1909395 RepID=A0A1V0A9T6_9ACTN|nr:hypothetical protein [Nonomuraea sp. ATCC 55076]AQZ66961.1 hypothetical protein BKM31_40855 [Nonomuraea sp. ATCC 55076]SPL94876.1 unnamed protein product [Actinomadura parvosata subsp. kistnae]